MLELAVNRERAADETHAACSRAELVEPLYACAHNFRLIAKSEIVVRGKNQHFAATFHLHTRRLRRVEIVESLVDAIVLQLFDACLQLVVEFLVERHARLPMRSRK